MKMRSSSVLAFVAIMGCAGLRAADYHFAECGSDANDGLSSERPLRTIGRLNALDLRAGDRVLFRRGDLFRGAIKANIPEMLKADTWDVVTIQQGSQHSPFPEKYEPFAGNLIAKIRELAPQAQIWLQQTWSYSPYSDRLSEWKMTPESMHLAVRGAYAAIAAKYGLRTIPTGDAVALYRKKLPVDYEKVYTKAEREALAPETKIDFYGDVTGTATRKKNGGIGIDAHHLNGEGKYLQACVWLAALFDVDVTKLAYEPGIAGFSDKARLMRKCAAEAVGRSRED